MDFGDPQSKDSAISKDFTPYRGTFFNRLAKCKSHNLLAHEILGEKWLKYLIAGAVCESTDFTLQIHAYSDSPAHLQT